MQPERQADTADKTLIPSLGLTALVSELIPQVEIPSTDIKRHNVLYTYTPVCKKCFIKFQSDDTKLCPIQLHA